MKMFTMKNSVSVVSSWSKRSAAIGSMMALAFFAACGDDVTNDSVVKAESYADKADLPTCGEKYDGMFATIPSKGEIYFCTQKNWQPVVNGKSAATKDSTADQFTCSTVELADKSGFKVVCGGDSLAVVKNGAKGEAGDKGDDGTPGDKGKDGESGPKGVDGKDLTLDSGLCVTRYYAYDVLIFECGDSTYVTDMTAYGVVVNTWWPSKFERYIYYMSGGGSLKSTNIIKTVSHEDGTGTKSNGTLIRFEGDEYWIPGAILTDELMLNDAIYGLAGMKVSEGATLNDTLGTEPFVGVEITDNRGIHWGGFCFTYAATDTVQLIAWNSKSKMARAKLAPATTETTVDIRLEDFVPDGENVSLDDVLKNVTKLEIVFAGGMEPGTYQNQVAIYEIGQFGGCGVRETIDEVKAKVQEAKGEATPDLVDNRGVTNTYKTVKIGNQVWMAENLRVPYNYLSAEQDEDPDDVTGEKMAYCPSTADSLAKFGCLYSWAAAMDSAAQLSGKTSTDPGYNVCGDGMNCTAEAPVQGICPNGWHLPSNDEIDTLLSIASYGGKYSALVYAALAGNSAEGLNWLGFSIDSTGYTNNYTSIVSPEQFYLWSSDDFSNNYDYSWSLYSSGKTIMRDYWSKSGGRSVRCIQDAAAE